MTIKALLLSAALLFPSCAFAHEMEKGPNGGRVVEASGIHLELVPRGNRVDVFITDKNEKAILATGYKGVAILLIEGKQERVVLEPEESNRLSGQVTGKIPAILKGVVQLSAPTKVTTSGILNNRLSNCIWVNARRGWNFHARLPLVPQINRIWEVT